MSKRYARLFAQENRAAFIAKLTDYLERHHLDGLDIDIEGPAINSDYSVFVVDAAKLLRPKGKLLTAAVAKGYGGSRIPDPALAQFDFVNVMAYDATGPWNPKEPGPHSSQQYAHDNIDYWLRRGVPADKLVLGVPFYGYGFGNDFRKSDYSYAAIVAAHPGAESADQAGDTVYYNGIPTIKAKTRFVLDRHLGGIMIWSLDCDAKGSKSLLAAIHETLTGKGTEASRNR
jgi:GH18 family chitinase